MSVTDCILVKTGLNDNYLFWLIIVNSQFKNIMVLGGCMYSCKERNCKIKMLSSKLLDQLIVLKEKRFPIVAL